MPPHRASRPFLLSVVPDGERWLIEFRGRRTAFVDRLSAVREAIRQAHQFSKDGSPIQVVCVDGARRSEIVWTSELEPAPPTIAMDGHGGRKPAGNRRKTPRRRLGQVTG